MTTVISTGSASSGLNPILPLSEEPVKQQTLDNVKKRLDEELTSVMVPGKSSKDNWEIVHCTVCHTDFCKGDLTSPTGSGLHSCPQCQGDTLKPGRFVRSPSRLRAASEKPRERDASDRHLTPEPKRTPPKRGERSPVPVSTSKGRPSSIIKRSSSLGAERQPSKNVSISLGSPMRQSPPHSNSDSDATIAVPDQHTGKMPVLPILTTTPPPVVGQPASDPVGSRRGLTKRVGKSPRAGSGSRRSSASKGSYPSRASTSSRKTLCSASSCCGNFSTDKCGSCRANICQACSKKCPLQCNLSPLCESCQNPDSHGCYAKVLIELKDESRATIEKLVAQHMAAQQNANARLVSLEQMVRDSKQTETQLIKENVELGD